MAGKLTFRLHKNVDGLQEESVNQNQVNWNVTLEQLLRYIKRSPRARNKHKTYKCAE